MLAVEYGAQFKRDYKRCAKKRLPLEDLHEVIRLIAENSDTSLEELRRHHNMHTLQGKWKGRQQATSSLSSLLQPVTPTFNLLSGWKDPNIYSFSGWKNRYLPVYLVMCL